MEASGFVLQETFCSEREEERRERFQKEFEGYLVDLAFGLLEDAGESGEILSVKANCKPEHCTERDRCQP